MCKSFLLGDMLDESTNFGCLYWAFVDVPPLQLMHIGKKEVLGLIDLMDGRFDKLFVFDPQAFGLEGGVCRTVKVTDTEPYYIRATSHH